MGRVIDIATRFRPTDFHETPEELKTWSDLKGMIKGLADFFTSEEEADARAMQKAGTLPESIDFNAIERYINFCYSDLLPGINKNREEAGLPRLWGRILDNVIMGDRWKRDRREIKAWYNNTTDRVFATQALPKSGQWGHLRDEFILGRVEEAAKGIQDILLNGGTTPNVKVASEYFTYRDDKNIPYGYAYSVRLEQQTIITGVVLEQVIADHTDTLSEYVYRELPESITKGIPFAELTEEQQAFYSFCTKKTLEGLGVTASLL